MKKAFYDKTKNLKPSTILKKFFANNQTENIKVVMDLGCGACKDTRYLLEKELKVIAVDVNDISEYIDIKNDNLIFIKSKFEDLKFSKVDLINAQNSLSFCNPKDFKDFINRIKNSINTEGYFIGNFFGKHDDWIERRDMTFLSKEEVLNIFMEFKIKYIAEIEEDAKTVLSKEKHWHVISIIAQKI